MEPKISTRKTLYNLIEHLYTLVDDLRDLAFAIGDFVATMPEEVDSGQDEQE